MSVAYLTDDMLVEAYVHFVCAREKFATRAAACIGDELIRRGITIEVYGDTEQSNGH